MYYIINYDSFWNYGCYFDFYKARNHWNRIGDKHSIIEYIGKNHKRKKVWPLKKKFSKNK